VKVCEHEHYVTSLVCLYGYICLVVGHLLFVAVGYLIDVI